MTIMTSLKTKAVDVDCIYIFLRHPGTGWHDLK